MERITRWLADKSARRERELSLTDALLRGRFGAYAQRRLAGFMLSRAVGAFTHVLESTLLFGIFADRGIVASLALKNTSLLAGAFYWGVLEVMRIQIRSDLSRNTTAMRIGRWLGSAVLIAVLALLLPLTMSVVLCIQNHRPFTVLDAYAVVSGLRLGVDVVVRTYYSGVYAIQRVPRPLATTLLGEPLGLLVVLLSWPRLGAWCFPLGLFASVVISRAFVVYYTARAYQLVRVPRPRVRWPWQGARARWAGDLPMLGRAGVGYLSTRIGSMLVLASLLGPLLAGDPPDEAVFALHFVATLLGAAGYWTQSFYPDFKRLEDETFGLMRRRLLRGLLRTSWVVGVLLWLASGAVVRWAAGSFSILPLVLFLLPLFVTMATLAALQLHDFTRGRFFALVAASVPMCGALFGVLVTRGGGSLPLWATFTTFAVTSAIAILWILGRVRARPVTTGVQPDVLRWARALALVEGPVRVACAATRDASVPQCRVVARRVAERLRERGGCVVAMPSRRVLFFERGPAELEAADLVTCAAGKLQGFVCTDTEKNGRLALQAAVERGLIGSVTAPAAEASAVLLKSEFASRFAARAVVADLKSEDEPLSHLSAETVRAIWRDATREVGSGTPRCQQSGFEVLSFRPGGQMRLLFAIPRTEPLEQRRSWRKAVEDANWAAAASVADWA